MALITLSCLAETNGPLLGIDPGTKTFGLAVSDTTRLIATPVETIRRKKFTPDAARIFALYDERRCGAMIIGYPVNMDGSEGPRAQSVKDFCINLMGLRDIPIMLWDERMSTAAVTRTLLEADTSRAKRAEAVDKLAATYILQGVLDRLRV
ncbi:MAG: Holliday junction resolvase RuvX [Robiginitomaculum sp.]|nr:Holliday junction resolvase RuvX [Robiginitomaculum sp.]